MLLPRLTQADRDLADRDRRPIVADAARCLWAMGPPVGRPVFTSARMPDVVLPDLAGRPFDLASLRGTKTLLVAWAPW